MTTNIFIFAILLLAISTLIIAVNSVRIVQQSTEAIVERFGQFSRTLKPGIHFITPIIENVNNVYSLKETLLHIPTQSIISKDNAQVEVDGIAYFQIIDTVKAAYVINDLPRALSNLVLTNIRTVMGALELDTLLSERELINAKLLITLDEATAPWGIKLLRVEIKDILPPKKLVEAMSQQLISERDRRSKILQAEGNKAAAILEAEGESKAIISIALANRESVVLKAKAEAEATTLISDAIANGKIESLQYFVAQSYVKSLSDLAASDNSKIIMVPLEASKLLGSINMVDELLKSSKTDHNKIQQEKPTL